MELAECRLCNKIVQQNLWYDENGVSGYNYSCGCISTHTINLTTWISKDGDRVDIKRGE